MNGQAVCSCIVGYLGVPPSCRPECTVNSDCNSNKACSNQKCIDPCIGVCGVGAKCQVINHNPICSCIPSYTGNPFVRCYPKRKYIKSNVKDLLISIYLKLINFNSCRYSSTCWKSLYSITLWTKFSV